MILAVGACVLQYVSLRFVVVFVEIQTHGFTAQFFGFKGRLLNHIVGLLPKQIIAIIHDLMLNCLPVVTYVIVCGFISNINQKLSK